MSALAKALTIARVNLVRQVRDRSSTFFVFVLPVIIILALGLQFGGAGQARLGVVAPADDPAAGELIRLLEQDSTRFEVRRPSDEATLRSQVERGQLEAGIVIPAGYGSALAGRGQVRVEFLGTTDALTTGLRQPIEAAVARQAAIVMASRAAAGLAGASFETASAAARANLGTLPGLAVEVSRVGGPGIFAGFGTFTMGAQSQLLLFVFLTSMTAASQLVLTKRLGVSRRMLSTPTGVATILAGEALGRLAVALLQAGFIVAVSSIIFGVAWGDPLAATALILLFSLVAAAVAMLVGAFAWNAEQAASLGVFAGLALGALGGCMVPWDFMPAVMQDFARLIPHSWAILGLRDLVREGGGIETVALNLGVLAAFAVVIMAIATWRFRRSIAA
jgi:ABC-2 type transport system permease protein